MMEEKEAGSLFVDAYIERCNKETETMIANESSLFLKQSIKFLKEHKSEFIYLEANSFEEIGVDAVSLEVDDVFGTYDVMLGLKLQKKYEKAMKEYLNANLSGEGAKFDLMFSLDDGLWNLNFTLDYAEGFHEEISIDEGFQMIYRFLVHLVETVKK